MFILENKWIALNKYYIIEEDYDDLHNTFNVNGGLMPSPSALNPTHE